MHEASLMDALFDEIERVAPRLERVRLVVVRLGELSGVDPELFLLAWQVAHADRGLVHAELEVVGEPARWVCSVCGGPIGEVLRCPACDAPARLLAGDALLLQRVELDDV